MAGVVGVPLLLLLQGSLTLLAALRRVHSVSNIMCVIFNEVATVAGGGGGNLGGSGDHQEGGILMYQVQQL